MNGQKLSAALRDRLESAAGRDLMEIVVELNSLPAAGPGSRAHRIAEARAAFAREAEPVEAAIRSASGEVLGDAWINQTLLARLPAAHVASLCALEQVRLLDLPSPVSLVAR
jgi:hypothetical protein